MASEKSQNARERCKRRIAAKPWQWTSKGWDEGFQTEIIAEGKHIFDPAINLPFTAHATLVLDDADQLHEAIEQIRGEFYLLRRYLNRERKKLNIIAAMPTEQQRGED